MNKELQASLRKQGVTITNTVTVSKNMQLLCEAPVLLTACEIQMRGSIGAFSYIRGGRLSGGLRKIGRYCSIAPGLTAGDSNHELSWISTHPFQYGEGALFKNWTKKPDFPFMKQSKKRSGVIIGNDVWIGANVMIMPGVTISDGAVIGGGAVVTKDIPPYAIAVGSPAKVIRYRFDEATIAKLLALQWWRFEADSLLGIQFDDVNKAMQQIREYESAGKLELIRREPIKILGSDLER